MFKISDRSYNKTNTQVQHIVWSYRGIALSNSVLGGISIWRMAVKSCVCCWAWTLVYDTPSLATYPLVVLNNKTTLVTTLPVFCIISDEAAAGWERHTAGRDVVPLVIRNDLHFTVMVDAHTRVGGPEVNTYSHLLCHRQHNCTEVHSNVR